MPKSLDYLKSMHCAANLAANLEGGNPLVAYKRIMVENGCWDQIGEILELETIARIEEANNDSSRTR